MTLGRCGRWHDYINDRDIEGEKCSAGESCDTKETQLWTKVALEQGKPQFSFWSRSFPASDVPEFK
jgi:hypothetical protein